MVMGLTILNGVKRVDRKLVCYECVLWGWMCVCVCVCGKKSIQSELFDSYIGTGSAIQVYGHWICLYTFQDPSE
jgi:hypothetical protein